MPELYDGITRDLAAGDVLMVERKMKDKAGKRYLWKFFMVVTNHDDWSDLIEGFVIGATNERLKTEPMRIDIDDDRNTVHYLPPDEWPNGVHAFRMALIMQRKIEDL